MTSVCVSSGPSQVKTGLPTAIYISPVFLASILPVQLEWLRPFIPYIPDLFLDLTVFCAADPPSQPTLTDATIAAVFAGGDFSAALIAGQLIQQALLNQYWYQVCECVSGTQPTAPTPQADPGGLPQVNPPLLVSGPVAQVCAQLHGLVDIDNVTGGPGIAIGTNSSFTTANQVVPVGITRADITYTNLASSSAQDEISFSFYGWTATGTLQNLSSTVLVGQAAHGTNPRHITVAVPAGLAYVYGEGRAAFGSTPWTQTGTIDVSLYCGGATPGQPLSPCCPPDETLNGMIRQILQYVQVIQRQGVPFGYIPGAVHSGLSGQGSISIQGLVGAKVDLTTIPSSYGRAGTSPTQYFDLGFLSWGTADGWPSSFHLEHDPTLMFPTRAGLYTEIEYDLAPGVVVTLTELSREP